MKAKPTGYNVDLKYQCPVCGSDLWATRDEAKTPGFRIVCCGKALELETVSKFTLHVDFANEVKEPPKTHQQRFEEAAPIRGKVIEEVQRGSEAGAKLAKLGFTGINYQTKAHSLAVQGYDVETIVRKCIADAN
jgi:hypothetical protein